MFIQFAAEILMGLISRVLHQGFLVRGHVLVWCAHAHARAHTRTLTVYSQDPGWDSFKHLDALRKDDSG